MAVGRSIIRRRISRVLVIFIRANRFFMIPKKDGLAVIKLSMIGINFKKYPHVQLVFIKSLGKHSDV